MAMIGFKRKSGWTWVTSAGGSVGYGPFSAGSGSFTLKSPTGDEVQFNYKSVGGGASLGSKFNAAGSTPDSFSVGDVYLSDTFSGSELSLTDVEGFCLSQEASLGAGIGGSAAIMLLGISVQSIPAEILKNTGAFGILGQMIGPDDVRGWFSGYAVNPKFRASSRKFLQSDAKAVLITAGFNAGPQLTAGISNSLGYVSSGKIQPAPKPPPPPKDVTVDPIPGKGLRVRVPSDILFDFDKASLKPDSLKVLNQIFLWIVSIISDVTTSNHFVLSVEGHTDGIGDVAYNRQLSLRRGWSVANWLMAHKVVAARNLRVVGWGLTKPLVPNRRPNGSDDPVGRAKNRRVEVFLLS
jgi:outer membrane protein OmpA-like peptidoglycan-associated protein